MTLQGKDYVVIVADDRFSGADDIAASMKGAGIEVRRVMLDTGVIFAVMDEGQARIVRKLQGVVQVEPGATLRMLV